MASRNIPMLQPVFFVGTPKSGTTFLLSLFDSHPSVVSLLETAAYHLPLRFVRDRAELIAKLQEFYSTLMSQHTIHAAVTLEDVQDRLCTLQETAPWSGVSRSVLELFLSVVTERMEAEAVTRLTHFIEKTPRQYDAVDAIFKDFPDAKIIHVLRDPRDNYLALKRMMDEPEYQGIGYHPTNFIRDRLLASLEAAYRNVAKYQDQYRLVFYEDLIMGGEPVIRKIADWLGIPWHDVLLLPSYNGELWKGNSLASDLKDRLKPFDRRPIGRWKSGLTEQEIDVLEWIIESYSLSEKYPPTRAGKPWQRFWQLMRPFDREFRRPGIAGGNQGAKRIMHELTWNYLSRRAYIAWCLMRRVQTADGRLTVEQFARQAVSNSASQP